MGTFQIVTRGIAVANPSLLPAWADTIKHSRYTAVHRQDWAVTADVSGVLARLEQQPATALPVTASSTEEAAIVEEFGALPDSWKQHLAKEFADHVQKGIAAGKPVEKNHGDWMHGLHLPGGPLARAGIVDIEAYVAQAVAACPHSTNPANVESSTRNALLKTPITPDNLAVAALRRMRAHEQAVSAAGQGYALTMVPPQGQGLATAAAADVVPAVGFGNNDEEAWPDPEPITANAPSVPAFKEEWLPPAVRRDATDNAHWTRVPLDYTGPAQMVMLASALGNRVMVRPNRNDPRWLESASALWGMVIAEPGSRKTPALSAVVAPMRVLHDAAATRNEAAFKNWQAAMENHDDTINGMRAALRKQAQSTGKDTDFAPVDEARKNAPGKPPEVHRVVQHATSVYLAGILRDNPHGVLSFHDELPPYIEELLEGQDAKARGLVLESWGGKNSFQYGSVSQGGINIPTNCMTLLGGGQPGPLTNLIHAAANGDKNANGFLQRFLCAVWPDRASLPRPSVPRGEGAAVRVADVVAKLATLNEAACGARFDGKHHYIDSTPEAQKLFEDWEDRFEAALAEETGAFASHLSKYKTLVAGWALLWTLVEWAHAGVNVWGVPTTPLPDVSPEAMTAAIGAAGYFVEHARRIYAMSVPDIVATRALAAKLIDGEDLDGKTLRYIYRKRWAGLTTPADVGEASENLRDAGWIKIQSTPSTTRGRPAVVIKVSPKRGLFKMEAHPGDEATRRRLPDCRGS